MYKEIKHTDSFEYRFDPALTQRKMGADEREYIADLKVSSMKSVQVDADKSH